MGRERNDMTDIANELYGKSVSHVRQPDPQRLEIQFTDDSVLAIALLHGRLTAGLTRGRGDSTSERHDNGPLPTRRQRDYLEFITRYILRYGVSPAESDIARHFLLSAPSVNQMVQMLERRGFITRQSGIPRSIAIVDPRKDFARPPQPAAAAARRPNATLHRTGARAARSGR
jgi:LexA DNA binding domain-containing protein